MENNTDFIATELLNELKSENIRRNNLIKALQKTVIFTIICAFVIVSAVVSGFLLYLNQYDFTSTTTATGVYAIIDSEGNVIAQDLTDEEITEIMEVVNGDCDTSSFED